MKRIYVQEVPQHVGKEVLVKGWVASRRDHGGLIFIDVRDHTGIVQVTIQPEQKDAFATAEQLRDEFVVAVTGAVKERDATLQNKNIETGAVEVFASNVTVLNKSDTPPIQVNTTQIINEEHRLKYRYLDLRRPKMQHILKRRSEYYEVLRAYMKKNDFVEVTTPILANSSPEGSRDFLVP